MTKLIRLPNTPRNGETSRIRHPMHNLAIQILDYCEWEERGEMDEDTALYLIKEIAVVMVSMWEGKDAYQINHLLEETANAITAKATYKERMELRSKLRDHLARNRYHTQGQ